VHLARVCWIGTALKGAPPLGSQAEQRQLTWVKRNHTFKFGGETVVVEQRGSLAIAYLPE
jgi:hypothetical protein